MPEFFKTLRVISSVLFPKLRFIDEFLAELGRIVRRETHQIFLDPEELEIIQIHFVHGVELVLELLRCQ